MPDIFTDETFAIETSVKTTHPLWVSVTGLAQGRTIKVAPKTFIVIPSHLEDYCGRYVQWGKPDPGQPIWTDQPITSHVEAECAFAEWAQRAFERKWELPAACAQRLLREVRS